MVKNLKMHINAEGFTRTYNFLPPKFHLFFQTKSAEMLPKYSRTNPKSEYKLNPSSNYKYQWYKDFSSLYFYIKSLLISSSKPINILRFRSHTEKCMRRKTRKHYCIWRPFWLSPKTFFKDQFLYNSIFLDQIPPSAT